MDPFFFQNFVPHIFVFKLYIPILNVFKIRKHNKLSTNVWKMVFLTFLIHDNQYSNTVECHLSELIRTEVRSDTGNLDFQAHKNKCNTLHDTVG